MANPDGATPAGGPAQGRRAADRGRYGRLSRQRVLASALEIVDRDGLSALSMRRLGGELGVEAMALYRYASGKDALLDGLVEAFVQELEDDLGGREGGGDPGADGAQEAAKAGQRTAAGERVSQGERTAAGGDGWRAELHRIALAAHRVALRHPNVVPLLATRLLSTPMARRPAAVLRHDDRILGLLAGAGLGAHRVPLVHRAFTAWLLGYLIVELRAVDDDPQEPDPAFRIGLHRISARDLPHLRALAPGLAEPGGTGPLAEGLDALLDRFA